MRSELCMRISDCAYARSALNMNVCFLKGMGTLYTFKGSNYDIKYLPSFSLGKRGVGRRQRSGTFKGRNWLLLGLHFFFK